MKTKTNKFFIFGLIFFLYPTIILSTEWNTQRNNEFNTFCISNMLDSLDVTQNYTYKQVMETCDCVRVFYRSKYPDHYQFLTRLAFPNQDTKAEAYQAMYDCSVFILGGYKQMQPQEKSLDN